MRAWGRTPLVRCACVVACVLAAAAPARARPVDDYLGRPVASITVQLEGRRLDEPALIALVETKVGAPLSMRDVRESISHLFSLGRFQDVQVDASALPEGVALVYTLVPLHSVDRVQFRGDLGLPDGRLRERMTERHGAFPPVGRAADAARTLQDLFAQHGYLRAVVTPRAEVEHAPERTTLVFDIQAGPRARIGNVDVRGAPAGDVLAKLGVRGGEFFDEPSLRKKTADLAATYRRRGHYEATVDYQAVPAADATSIDLRFDVHPGPHVTVRFEGDPLPRDRREALVPIEREGSVDEDLLEDSTRRILDYLHSQGYWKARAEHRRTADAGELTIVFSVATGRQHRVGAFEVSGNAQVPLSSLPPARLQAGELFVESILDADVAALTERYRQLGYTSARVQSGVAERGGGADPLVDVRLTIAEGVSTTVGAVAVSGHEPVPVADLRARMALAPGKIFYPPQLRADRDALALEYANRGYPDASIDAATTFSADRRTVDLTYVVRPGPRIMVDHVLVVGNRRTKTRTIERELLFKPGQPLGLEQVVESQRRLSALGLFRRVRITELRHGGSTRDVLVTVEEAPPTSVGYGGGLEGGKRLRRSTAGGGAVERLEFAPRGFFEVGRRNLWGKNRSANLFTRLSLRPRDDPGDPSGGVSNFGFSEYRVLGTFREPRTFGWSADAQISAFLEQSIRSSFNLNRRGVHADLTRRLTRTISLTGRYAYDRNRLFDERFNDADKPLIDRLFPEVTLSTFSSAAFRDTRDDALDPGRGALLGLEGQVAARRIGSEVGFTKTFMQAFAYRRLPTARRMIVAAGARLGMASGFRREAAGASVRDIPASERFFAGGDTTVRGFAIDRLGDTPTIDQDGFPKGGHALVILNTELRTEVWRDLGAVAFLDAGNVFARVNDLSLGNIRGGAGLGVRYRSPIGPIRVDLGFKLDRRRFPNGELERLTALHISIGHAF